jgi:hypothetical protein
MPHPRYANRVEEADLGNMRKCAHRGEILDLRGTVSVAGRMRFGDGKAR